MSASLKFHAFRTEMGDQGTESCDYRGQGEFGAGENDQHATIPQLEVDPCPDELVAVVLEEGPAANRVFMAIAEKQPDAFSALATALGLDGDGPVGLRVGIWDK